MSRDGSELVGVRSGRPALESAAAGLSSAEAARRLAQYGPNEVVTARRVRVWARIVKQLRDPLILVLLAAAGLTVATGDLPDSAIILLVVVVNTAVGVAQEVRAERAVAALTAMAAPHALVRREGEEIQVAAREVVPGDVVMLAEGDV